MQVLHPAEQPQRGSALTGEIWCFRYKKIYTKALGKDGILVSHEQTVMHCHAAEREIDEGEGTTNWKKTGSYVLQQIVLAAEFLAKHALPFRGQKDFQVDFSKEDSNRGNLLPHYRLWQKEIVYFISIFLQQKKNAKYTNKTVQNEIIHIFMRPCSEKN